LGELVKAYPYLFGRDSGGVDPDNAWFVRRWGWLVTVDNLVDGSIDKYHYVYNMPVVEFLNLLAFQKDKQKLKKEQQQKANQGR
jgi:hypothetical protein